jgi:FdrA protein
MMATILNSVRPGSYLDSVALMRLSRDVAARPGVEEAALMMGTPANKRVLAEAGLLAAEGEAAAGNDLIVAVRADGRETAEAAIAAAEDRLTRPPAADQGPHVARPRTWRAALQERSDATLALISVPGGYAVAEARRAIRRGLDVMLFSDNVSLEDERTLKREARALGRLVMGPDCGTAIINGTPLAFANRVPRGDIGIIGASGTGMQEVTSLVAMAGKGISQAIGVGGRDLAREIGGISTLTAIDLLDADAATRRIVLISKPPHPEVARAVVERAGQSGKAFTICFLGAGDLKLPPNARAASTLKAAAEDALDGVRLGPDADALAGLLKPRCGAVVGLFCGGTLAAEAQLILLGAGRTVASNAPIPGAGPLTEAGAGSDRILDLGADEFTRGRPHPMLDPSLRNDQVRLSLADRGVAVVLVDLVIGFGAHAAPAGELAVALAGGPQERPHVVASVTGTEGDPQVRSRQVAALERAGVIVAPSNADAVGLALALSRRMG